MRRWPLAAILIATAVLWSACGVGGDAQKKIVINENVCAGVDFLRMKLGQETKIVVDNTQHSEDQDGLSVFLSEFPVVVIGKLPEGTQVGSTFTSLQLTVPPGERKEVTVEPIFTGQFIGRCNVGISAGNGGTGFQYELTFQIVDK